MSNILGVPLENFQFNKRSVYFGARKWSRGVTTVIKEVFAPFFKYKKLPRRPKTEKTGLPFRKARNRGKLLDEILGKWVSGKKTRCRILEPRAIIAFFESRRWSPLASQLVVAWREGRIATMIDLVLFDETLDEIIIVEIKSGCEYRNVSTGSKLQHLKEDVTDAPVHQHQLQVLLGKELFRRTYLECTKRVRALLVYVSKEGDLDVIDEEEFRIKYENTTIGQAILATA